MSSALPQKKTVLEYALEYAALGWPVLPLHYIKEDGKCSCGNVNCKSPGKHPATISGVKNATTNPRVIQKFFHDPRMNVGIGCDLINVVDIDPRNGGDVTWQALIKEHGDPETVIANTGGGGLHYLFTVPPGKEIKRLGKGIDIKKAGGYIVVEPSNHSSGGVYEWEGAYDPLDGAKVAQAPDWILKDKGVASALEVRADNTRRGFLPLETIAELRSALSYIDVNDYEWWVKVGIALKSTDIVQSFGIWDEWSQLSDKYNAGEMRGKWSSFGVQGDLNYESIFYWAEHDFGWPNPAKYKVKIDKELEELVEKANQAQKISTIEKEVTPYTPIPVPELESLGRFLNDQLWSYDIHCTQAMVLSIAGTLASRKYQSANGDCPNLYVSLISESINSLKDLGSAAHHFMRCTDNRKSIRATRINAPSTIYKALHKHPVMHYIEDDYGRMLAFSKRQPSGVLRQALNVLMSAQNQRELYFDQDVDVMFKNVDDTTIYAPSVNVVTLTPDSERHLLANSAEIADGSLEQFITVSAGDVITNDDVKIRGDIPAPLKEKMQLIKRPAVAGNLADQPIASLMPASVYVEYDDAALNLVGDFDLHFKELLSSEPLFMRSLASGARVNLRKLCVLLAAWDNPIEPLVTVRLANWAGNYILSSLQYVLREVEINGIEDGKRGVYERVLSAIAKRGPEGLTMRDIVRNVRAFRNMKAEERSDLLEALVSDAEIYQIDTKSKNNHVKTAFVFREFVKKEENDIE